MGNATAAIDVKALEIEPVRNTQDIISGRAPGITVALETQGLWDEFCHAFHLADVLLVCDIYPAGEEAVPGVTAEALARSIGERGHRQAAYAGDLKSAIDRLAAEVKDGDVVLTLGAGSVWTAGDELLRRRGA